MASRYKLLLAVTIAAYFAVSKYLFDKVHETSHIVIDELFHIPQGLLYCQRNFSYWDPKITTLPGLYLVSTAFLGTYFPCSTYSLRFINLVASCINLCLFASIIKFVYFTDNSYKIVLQALNLALLPPLYFFCHLYYTDTLSLTFLLAFSRLCFENKHKLMILLFGLCSIMMRQTNVVWVAMVFGHKALDITIKTSRVIGNKFLVKGTPSKRLYPYMGNIDTTKLKRYYGLSDLVIAIKYHVSTCFSTLFKHLTLNDSLMLLTHCIPLTAFLIFVYINGAIVLGDKTAHEVSLHLPQLFYFLVFYGVFGLPYLLAKLPSTIKLMFRNKRLVVLFTVIFTFIVHYNTVVHPYLLADNRHYTFYIWNRWYGRHDFAIHVSVPVYVFLLFSLYDNLKEQNCITFLFPYTICLFLVLSLQKMIEIRYFLVPYIILRLRFTRPSFKITLFEFVWYVLLNSVTFYMFFTKEIWWSDFDYAQRLMW